MSMILRKQTRSRESEAGNADESAAVARSGGDAEARFQELQSLHQVSQIILESIDAETMMQRILQEASNIGGFDIGLICFVADSRETLEPVAHVGFHDRENVNAYRRHILQQPTAGVVDRVLQSKRLRVVNLDETGGVRTFRNEGVRSLVIVPLRTEQHALGVLYLGSRRPKGLEPGQINILEAMGIQTGIAVQKLRLFESAERRAKEQQALNLIAMAINQSLDLKEVLEIAADKTVQVTGRQRVNFKIKDQATGKTQILAYRGFSEEEVEALRQTSAQSLGEQVFTSGQPLIINHRAKCDPENLLPQTQSVAWIPIKAGGKVVAVLGISDDQSKPFAADEVELLQAIGSVIGVAIDNARLFSESEARCQELQALHQIGRAILESVDLTVMMQSILDKACEIGGFEIGLIRLLSHDGNELEPVASRGYRDLKNIRNHRTKVDGYTSGDATSRVIDDKRVHVIDITRSNGTRTFKKEEVCALVAIPLQSHEDVLGVIQLGNRRHREFSESELGLLEAIGSQAGIAIQKARLFDHAKKTQKELAAKAEELARSNTELEHFAYIASHDLQEPLRMVASYVQLLARRYKGKLDNEADEFIGFAVDGATRMQALINALLAYSRIQTKGKPFESVDCEEVIALALKNLQMALDESKASVTHDPLPTVMGDATQLGQLFQNLIGNAIKFRGKQAPEIHLSAELRENDWCFSFRDNGIGIDPQYAERIFVIFQRLHSKEEYPGTGIGLALCKKIVERHGGQISVESVPGKGATFHFTIAASILSEGGHEQVCSQMTAS